MDSKDQVSSLCKELAIGTASVSHGTSCSKRMRIFLLLFYATFACWALSVAFCETQQRVFFSGGQDMFADFFNNVRYVAGRDPYFDTTIASLEHIYPPICYLIFYPFAWLYSLCSAINLPDDGLPAFWGDRVAITSCIFFMLFSTIPLIWAVWRIVRKKVSLIAGVALTVSFLTSGIMMFAFERGNLVVLAASALAVFLIQNESSRGNGTGWLALAISMKIYPALFVSLLIRQRRFKQIALVVVCTMALGFLPLLFFKHGPIENSMQLMQNVKDQGALYYNACPPNLSVSSYVAGAAMVLDLKWLAFAAKVLRYGTFALGLLSLMSVMLVDEKWKRWFLLASAATFCSNFAGYYTLLYFVPSIYSYLSSDSHWRTADWLYMAACIVWLTPLQFGLLPVRNDSINPFLSGCMICVVAIVIMVEELLKNLRKRMEQKQLS